MGISKMPQWQTVNKARSRFLDAATIVGEQSILLQMYHAPTDQGIQPRCTDCFDNDYSQNSTYACDNCFAPGTLVRTYTGYTPIEEIKVGELVLTEDGSYQRVTNVMERDYQGVAYMWRTAMMTNYVISTGEHPLKGLIADHNHKNKRFQYQGSPYCMPSLCEPYIRNDFTKPSVRRSSKLKGRSHTIGWVNTEDIKKRSWLVTKVPNLEIDFEWIDVPQLYIGSMNRNGSFRKGPRSYELTEDFLWMIGLYLAEGSAGSRHISFALHSDETKYQDRLVRIFAEYGYTARVSLGKGDSLRAVVSVSSSILSEWFKEWLGNHSEDKIVPEEFMTLPPKKIRALLQGIWDGDGSKSHGYDGKTQFEVGQTSEILALQMAEITQRSGFQPLQRHQDATTLTPIGNARQRAYVTTWESDDFEHRHRRGRWVFENESLAQVVFHQPRQYNGKVYNLEVATNNTYVVQNTVVHNCYGSTFEGGVKARSRVWTIWEANKSKGNTTEKRGEFITDQRSIQLEPLPIVLEGDFLIRVKNWSPTGIPLELYPDRYRILVTTDAVLNLGGSISDSTDDVYAQYGNASIVPRNHPIYQYPVDLTVPFDRLDMLSRGPVT